MQGIDLWRCFLRRQHLTKTEREVGCEGTGRLRVALEKEPVLDLTVMRPGKACVFGGSKDSFPFPLSEGRQERENMGQGSGRSKSHALIRNAQPAKH